VKATGGILDSTTPHNLRHADVLEVHDPDPATPVEETWVAIADLATGDWSVRRTIQPYG
jgi:aryl-alcohol dehydrogenase-like predicted oxidoreductase